MPSCLITLLLFVFPFVAFLRIYEQLPEVKKKREEEKEKKRLERRKRRKCEEGVIP